MVITQQEADYLMNLEKRFEKNDTIVLGDTNLKYQHPLISIDGRERFYADIWSKGLIVRKRYTLQERGRSVIVLVRLDIGGSPHTNPDGEMVPCPHMHIYREGFHDKWAFPVNGSDFTFRNLDDIVFTFEDFARFCNITNLPEIQRSLV